MKPSIVFLECSKNSSRKKQMAREFFKLSKEFSLICRKSFLKCIFIQTEHISNSYFTERSTHQSSRNLLKLRYSEKAHKIWPIFHLKFEVVSKRESFSERLNLINMYFQVIVILDFFFMYYVFRIKNNNRLEFMRLSSITITTGWNFKWFNFEWQIVIWWIVD